MTSHLTRPRLSPELHCQQHAMALDSYSYDCCVFPPLLDWEWDWGELDTLGLGGVAEAGGTAVQEQEAFFPATRKTRMHARYYSHELGLLARA